MEQDRQGDHAGLQVAGPVSVTGLFRRERPLLTSRVPSWARPPARVALLVTGFAAWAWSQGFLSGLLGFIEDGIPRYSLASLPALPVLVPFWFPLPGVAGIAGARDGRAVTAAAAALMVPFAVLAGVQGLAYGAPGVRWLLFAPSLLLLAASEEVFCRGFAMDALAFGKNRKAGLVLSSLLFALLHAQNPHASVPGLFNIFLTGALFGLMRIVSGGLWYPVLFHWLWNLMTGMVFGWSVSGHESMPTLFRPAGLPPWGGFGPEESVLMTLGAAGGIAILLFRLRSPVPERAI